MEYVQTVLVQIAATRLDAAEGPQGLLSEFEAHRDFAAGQRGFLGMRISRTAHPEGNVQVVVETRWSSNNAMADYSTLSNNVESIVKKHADETVAGSLQVHRMEALKGEAAEAPGRVYDRLALALFIPVGVLAFALLVIYGLSRVYLSLPSEAATPLAAGIALGILGIAWYFSSNPSVPRWQLAGVAAVALATLAIGGTAAAVYDEGHKEVKAPPAPQASPAAGTTPSGPAGAQTIDMLDFYFQDASGQKNPTISVKAGQEVTISLVNKGAAPHNVHVAGTGGYSGATCKAGGPDPCSKPELINAGGSGTITLDLAAGTYDYRCDIHPDQMKGKVEAT